MAKAYKLTTTVQAGHRIEITAPEVAVGRHVEVIVLEDVPEKPPAQSMLAYLDSLPRIEHTPAEWQQIDLQFQEERDAWER